MPSRKQTWVTVATGCFLVGLGLGISFSFQADFLSEGRRRGWVAEEMTYKQLAIDHSHHLLHDVSWCPQAKCRNSDLCKPCQRRFLFILSTARSASTTLTYMLDTLPGVRMSGENNDQLRAIRDMMGNVRSHPTWRRGTGRQCAWGHNKAPPGAFACVGQSMMGTINPPSTDKQGRVLEDDSETIVGMKTIRFVGEEEDEMHGLVRWIKDIFPCARIIINYRSDIEALAESQLKALPMEDKTDAKGLQKALQDDIDKLRKAAEWFGEQAYVLDSSAWLKDISELNKIVEWLGFHPSCAFKEYLEFNTDGFAHGKQMTELDPNCRYMGKTEQKVFI